MTDSPPHGRAAKRAREERVLQLWEDNVFKDLCSSGPGFQIQPQVLSGAKNLVELTTELLSKFNDEWAKFPDPKPPLSVKRGMLAVSLQLDAGVDWDARSDILSGRLLCTLFHDVLRAHNDGVYTYENGAWMRIEEIPEPLLRDVESALSAAQTLYLQLMQHGVGRAWADVFECFLAHPVQHEAAPVCDFEYDLKHWAAIAGKDMKFEKANFTSSVRGKTLIDAFGSWFVVEKAPARSLVNFIDATLKLPHESGEALTQIYKSSANGCYTHIPLQLTDAPSDEDVHRVRMFLATTFANNPEGRLCDSAMEALALHNVTMPQKIIIFRGAGGDGKSARSHLRNNVFAGGHKYMSTSVFEFDEEFRKQGSQFAHARCITFQECSANFKLKEDTFKTFVGGEEIACRPNYGVATKYHKWDTAGKYWEMNLNGPSIHGDPEDLASLRSWTRRIIVVNLTSAYTADLGKFSPEEQVFLEDPDLKSFLGSPAARMAYTRHFLLPFLEKHSANDCVKILSDLPERLTHDTGEFVQSMAKKKVGPTDIEAARQDAKSVLWNLHGGKCIPQRFLSVKGVIRSRCIPLAPGEKQEARVRKLQMLIAEYPYLFKFVDETLGFRRLNANVGKYLELRSNLPTLNLPTVEEMPVVFDMEDKYASCVPDMETVPPDHVFTEQDSAAGYMTETVNLAALKAWQRTGKDRNASYLSKYIKTCESSEAAHRQDDGKVSLFVPYVRKYGCPGRRYARGMSAQHLTKESRSVAFGSSCVDLDIRNCHPTLMYLYLQGKGCSENFRLIAEYAAHPATFRRFVASLYDITEAEAKNRIIRLFYGGAPLDQNPLMWAVFDEVQRATDILLADPKYAYLNTMFGSRPRPMASRLSYALFAMEDDLLDKMVQTLRAHIREVTIMVYMFDGLIVQAPREEVDAAMELFRERYGVTVVTKSLSDAMPA